VNAATRSFPRRLRSSGGALAHRPSPVEALRAAAGLDLLAPHRGSLRIGELQADVRIDGGDLLRVRLPLKSPDRAPRLLERQRELPGNVRFARTRDGLALLAETWVDGAAHVPRSLGEIAQGFAVAVDEGCPKPARTHPAHANPCGESQVSGQALRAALAGLGWGEDAVVALDQGWQLRPRAGGNPIAVRLEASDEGLWLWRRVLERVPAEVGAAAVSDLALRLNARLRLVRLTLAGGALVAESRAHAGLVTPAWIALLARAVAAAYQHVRAPLETLAENPRVADGYVRCFLRS